MTAQDRRAGLLSNHAPAETQAGLPVSAPERQSVIVYRQVCYDRLLNVMMHDMVDELPMFRGMHPLPLEDEDLVCEPEETVYRSLASFNACGEADGNVYRSVGAASNLWAPPLRKKRAASPSWPSKTVAVCATSTSTFTTANKLQALVELQRFDGTWELNADLAGALGKTRGELSPPTTLIDSHGDSAATNGADVVNGQRVWATALALAFLETTLASHAEEWSLLAAKASAWLRKAGVQLDVLLDAARGRLTEHATDAVDVA